MNKKEIRLIEKISKLFWKKGLNMSRGIKTTPSDTKDKEGKTLLTEESLIDIVNIGVEYSTGTVFVRGQYRNSKTWFQFPIMDKHIPLWTSRLTELHIESVADIDEDEDSDIIF